MDNLTLWALAAVAITQIADIITTERGLRNGARELNPILRFAMEKLGRGWIMVKLALAGGATYWLLFIQQPMWLWAIAAVTGAVAAHNWRLVR